MDIFKVTYQDKALNQRSVEIRADGWMDVIIYAYSCNYRRSDEKILYIEWVREVENGKR